MKSLSFKLLVSLFVIIGGLLVFNACTKDGSINLLSLQEEIALGKQLSEEIKNNPDQYKLLDTIAYAEAYEHLERMVNAILSSNEILYRDEFAWDFNLIHNDTVLNAFAAPGGYIYVFTGLIKYLDNETQLAGVLGHEIAHADKRHSGEQLTKIYGVQLLLELLTGGEGNSELLKEIATGLIALKFSRNNESEADEYSVHYLCDTEYVGNGAAGFFEKITASGSGTQVPEFLSTHPNPENRVEKIHSKTEELGCTEGELFETRYAAFKASLP